MVGYRDSSYDRPNAAQAAAAYAAGVRVWGGYLATVDPRSVNLATTWTQADFDVLRAAGIAPIAFASGWDDAAACGALARAWRVRLILDCEDGIRGDGPWVDGWLGLSGAGLYGLCDVHYHVAPAHIVARYPGVTVPAASWDPACPLRPTGLLGWQAEGGHVDPVTGLNVDGGWVDDGFALEGNMIDQATLDRLLLGAADAGAARAEVTLGYQVLADGSKDPAAPNYLSSQFDRLAAMIQAIPPAQVDVNALAATLEALLAPHLAPGLDPQVVAKDVALELGKALDAAP